MLALITDFSFFFSPRNSLEMFKTNWNDNFHDMNEKYFSKNKENSRMNAMKVVRQASLLVRHMHAIYNNNSDTKTTYLEHFDMKVRRDALKNLLNSEHNQYESELKSRGLSFHKERI